MSHKYGINRKVMFQTESETEALLEEVRLIRELRTYIYDQDARHCATNMTIGGDGGSGYRHTDEAKRKLSEPRGKRSPDVGAKIAAALRGIKRSDETRKRMSDAHLGHSPSKETRAKLSQAGTGRHVSEETRNHLRKVNQQIWSDAKRREHGELIKKICAEKPKRPPRKLSEETKAKMKLAQQERRRREAEQGTEDK